MRAAWVAIGHLLASWPRMARKGERSGVRATEMPMRICRGFEFATHGVAVAASRNGGPERTLCAHRQPHVQLGSTPKGIE
jgi:hypothetical protein